MERAAFQATVHGVTKDLDMTEHMYTHTHKTNRQMALRQS